MRKVYILNDNYSTYDFVVKVLTKIFRKTNQEAAQITNDVHNKGRGFAGIYTQDIALTKVNQVDAMARKDQYPLKAVIE
jgi:ATP-dependent Clp protease adaptor protein ClpS